MTAILTEIHGQEIGLDDDRALVVKTGVIKTVDGSAFGFPDGIDVEQFSAVPQRIVSVAYTTVQDDAGKHLYHPASDTTARVWTIAANASVAYLIGTTITFVNEIGAGTITIAINSDTLWMAGNGTTGSRSLPSGCIATAMKVTSTRWVISGAGLT